MGRTVALVIIGTVLPMISCMEKPGTPNSPSGASNQETVKLNDEAPTTGPLGNNLSEFQVNPSGSSASSGVASRP